MSSRCRWKRFFVAGAGRTFPPALGFRVVVPKLRKAGDKGFLCPDGAAQQAGIDLGADDHIDLSAQNQKGGGAVVVLAEDDFAGGVFADGGVISQDFAQWGSRRETGGVHLGKRLRCEKHVERVLAHRGVERFAPARGAFRLADEGSEIGIGWRHGVCFRRRSPYLSMGG